MPARADARQRPGTVALVVGTTAGGTGAHVRMLAAGLAARGIAVSVIGPSAANARFGFGTLSGVTFAPAEFGDRPRPRDLVAVGRVRTAVDRAEGGGAEVVHAHGLRAGALTVLALRLLPASRRPRLVVTVHNAPPAAGGATPVIYRLLERLVARGADLVLCVSPDLGARLRAAGARRVGRAVVPAAGTETTGAAPAPAAVTAAVPAAVPAPVPTPVPAPGRPSVDRPLVLAAGRLVAQKDFGSLLAAAVSWRDLDPAPRLAIAGEGALDAELRAQAAAAGVDVDFLGHRDDVAGLLAAAAVFVLPSRWEGQPLVLQEALRAGVPIVATRVGGIPGLVGGDGALLVAPGDVAGLAAAVRAVLTDPPLAARLRAAASRRAAALPTADDGVTAALESYAAALNRHPTAADNG